MGGMKGLPKVAKKEWRWEEVKEFEKGPGKEIKRAFPRGRRTVGSMATPSVLPTELKKERNLDLWKEIPSG